MTTRSKRKATTSSVKASFPVTKKSRIQTKPTKSSSSSSSTTKSSKTKTKAAAAAEPKQLHQVQSTIPPVFIFRHVGYTQKQNSARQCAAGSPPQKVRKQSHPNTLTSTKKKVVQYVEERYLIPADFERPVRFGPLSGSNYQDRVVMAYMRNLLERNAVSKEVVLGFASTEAKVNELMDHGFEAKSCRSMLVACGWVVKDALEMLCDN